MCLSRTHARAGFEAHCVSGHISLCSNNAHAVAATLLLPKQRPFSMVSVSVTEHQLGSPVHHFVSPAFQCMLM